jgi:enediyne biosynthesis protein E4
MGLIRLISYTNKSAIGTKIRIKAVINGQVVWQLREISAQSSYCGQNDLRAYFGLGDAAIIEEIRVQWLPNVEETYLNISGNQFITIVEGQGILGLNTATMANDIQIYPNPTTSVLNIDSHENEIDSINIYNTLGQLVLEISNLQPSKSIDVSSLKSGNYLVKVNSDKGSSSVKLVKK